MKKEIIKNETGSEVTVLIELRKRILSRDQKMTFTTRMVKTMLENEKIKVDKCIISDRIDNNSELSKRNGKWKFSLLQENTKPILHSAEPTDGLYSTSSIEMLDNLSSTASQKTKKKRKTKKKTTSKKKEE